MKYLSLSLQPKMNIWVFHTAIQNKLYKYEIPTRKFSHQPKMNIWVFHQTIEKQIIY
jgi:hypothetical protein